MDRRHFIALAGSVSVFALAGALAPAAAQEAVYPAEYATIVEASKTEGSVLIYQNMNSDVWAAVKVGFETKYPWLKVETLDLEANEVGERYLSEVGSGRSTADVLVTVGPDQWLNLSQRGEIVDYASPEGAAYDDWTKPLPGVYTMMTDPIIFFYNKVLLPPEMVPTGMEDLVAKVAANPEVFSGKITTYAADLNTFGYTVQYAMLKGHGDKIWDWYKALAPHTKPENGAGPMAEKVASGEYVLAYLTGSGSSWAIASAPGGDQLVGWSYVGDGTPLIPRGVAVAKAASHPNAARLMLDYILSPEGQLAFSTTGRTVLHPAVTEAETNGVQTYASVVAQVGAENILPVPYEEDMITGYDAFVANWKAAFGG